MCLLKNETHQANYCTFKIKETNEPINVKPQGGGGGGQTQGNLTFSWKSESNPPPPGTY